MQGKVLVTGASVDARFLQPLVDQGLTVTNPTGVLSESELASELEDSVAYLLGGDEYASETALSAARALKIVAFLGVGYESFVDAKAARQLGIHVTNTPGTLTQSMAEFTIGQLLNVRRRLTEYTLAYLSGDSGGEAKQQDLASTPVGIIGMGAIGSRIAQVLVRGFGAKVSYYSRTRKPELEDSLGITYKDLNELFASSGAVIVMTPGNDETRGLVGREQFDAIDESSGLLLVNTARPDIVEAEALLSALNNDSVAIAAYDAFYEGPEETVSSLRAFGPERLLITGHIGSLTADARDGMARMAVGSILNILRTDTDSNIVNG